MTKFKKGMNLAILKKVFSMSDRISKLKEEYIYLFGIADKSIKEAETSLNFNRELLSLETDAKKGLLFPAVNELRCAAYHISLAFSFVDELEVEEQYIKANRHCKRATYEALNGLLQFYINSCNCFRQDYRTVLLTEIIPDYINDCRRLNLLKKSIPDRAKFAEIDDYYNLMYPILQEIQTIYEKWDASRQEINKKLDRDNWNRFYTIIGVIAAVATIVAFFLGLFR